jgi:type III secretion system (T3SS) protein YscO
MIGQLKVLLRIKELKEQQAFRLVHTKRREVAEAASAIAIAREKIRENAATLPAREDAIYRGIIGRVVNYDKLEETKNEMLALEREHTKLVDAVERATHVHARLEKELAEAVQAHGKITKDRDKYIVLTEEVSTQFRARTTLREEAEVEDIFSSRRRRSA